ncbi:tetratricopeptide repeat protein [Salmonella enterica]
MDIRFKLCDVYNKVNDIPSSQSCLRELLNNSPTDESYLLAAKNYLLLEENDSSLLMVTKALEKNANNGEAYNVRGEILARKGDYDKARIDFEKAKGLFVAEELVNNNLAMLAILQHDYSLAYSYLMPLYSRGYNSPEIVHNLIFVLIKMGDHITADSLIRQNSLDDSTGGLITRLADIEPSLNIPPKPTAETKDQQTTTAIGSELIPLVNSNFVTKPNVSKASKNDISNVLIGDHGKFVRFVFITPEPLKGVAQKGIKDNHAKLKISNAKSNKKIDSIVIDINKFTKSINSIDAKEVDGELVLVFDTRRPIKKVRIYNSTFSKVSTNKLVFDIIYN